MGLFSTLASTSNDQSSSSTLPTVIQLHTDPTAISFSEEDAGLVPHGLVAYQAVPLSEDSDVPNLGVWSCQIQKDKSDELLKIAGKKASLFVFVVDLADFRGVEPTISTLQQTLIRYLIDQKGTDHQGSTSLFNLRSNTFGLASEDTSITAAAPDETDRNVKFNLCICAKLMNEAETTKDNSKEYETGQSLQLIMYHLRRFARNVGASLAFVGKELPQQAALSPAQVAGIWRELALGKTVTEEQEGFYGPPQGDEEDLIETVLLRNASYPGHWDATKDSLWKVFPVQVSKTEKKEESKGDEDWLSELQSSMAAVADSLKSPPPKKAATNTEKKTPGKDVNDFFASLLDK